MTGYRCLVADPPWAPLDSLGERGAESNYRVLKTEEICRFLERLDYPVANNAVLFLWELASMKSDSLRVAEAWGFRVVSDVVWRKLTKDGKPWFGMGRTVRRAHETALICLRGPASQSIRSRSVRSEFAAPVPVDANGDYIHSAKPPEFFTQIVEPLIGGPTVGGPCVEIFARTRRPNWDAIGDQLPTT